MGEEEEKKFLHTLAAKKRKPDTEAQIAWEGVGRFGMVGWSFTIPVLGGLFLGWLLDRAVGHGHFWMTMLFFGGLILGCVSTAYWLFLEYDEIEEPHKL